MAKESAEAQKQAKALALFAGHEQFLAGQPGGKRLVFKDADFAKLRFFGLDLRESVLSGSNLQGSQFIDTNFGMADLFCVNANDADFSRSSFDRADIRGANLMRARLVRAVLTKADLRAGQIVQWTGGEKSVVLLTPLPRIGK